MAKTFLTAEWRKLIMANYVVREEELEPYLPVGTGLDRYKGRCYVSLVGFLFQDTRLKSVPVPFHRTFEEVNLRFYVQHARSTGERRRGVVFISELVPRFALTLVANMIYGENYASVPMRHHWGRMGSSVPSVISGDTRVDGMNCKLGPLCVRSRLKPIAPRSSSRNTIGVTPNEATGPRSTRCYIRDG